MQGSGWASAEQLATLHEGAVFKATGQQPCILHFSGAAAYHCMHQWAGLLGVLSG